MLTASNTTGADSKMVLVSLICKIERSLSMFVCLHRSVEWVIVPLRECEQPDVFSSLGSHACVLAASLRTYFWLAPLKLATLGCFCHMGKVPPGTYSLKRNLFRTRMAVYVNEQQVLVHYVVKLKHQRLSSQWLSLTVMQNYLFTCCKHVHRCSFMPTAVEYFNSICVWYF